MQAKCQTIKVKMYILRNNYYMITFFSKKGHTDLDFFASLFEGAGIDVRNRVPF